jgi:molecular chaperone GrpE
MTAEGETTEEPAAQGEGEGSGDDAPPAADVNDILSSPAFLKRKLEVLESDIAKAEEDTAEATERKEIAREEWGPQLEALEREYTNIQQRMMEQNQDGDSDAKVRVVKGILDLLDNFDRASGVIVAETEAEKAIEAEYKAAYQDILDQFKSLGVTEVETVGKEFDYELHQAVMQMPGTDYEEGFVCQEFQKGFIMGEALIRPAMVAVAL